MSRRVIHTVQMHPVMVKVYRDSETSEFVVRLYINGQLVEEADYFSSFNPYDREDVKNAKEDAIATALAMASRNVPPINL